MSSPTNNLFIKKLVEFGLSEKEANVYLALIELELATVSEIAKTGGINRSSTYVVLESLKKKGLVTGSEDKKIQKYIAISPEMLLQEATEKARKAEEVKHTIRDMIPELKALHKDTRQKPKIRVFEGKQSFIHALEDSLDNKTKMIRECTSFKNIFSIIPEHFSEYLKKRVELGIKMKGIHPDNKTERKMSEMFPKLLKLDKSICIPEKKYQFPADIVIYDNRIAYLSGDKKGFAIIIESKEMAEVMKNMFDLAYQEAQRLSKTKKAR